MRTGRGLVMARGRRGIVYVLLLGSYLFLPPTCGNSITYKRFAVDLTAPQFTSCPPLTRYVPGDASYNPLFHCAALCAQEPACTFARHQGDTCELHWVQIRVGAEDTGVPSGYRPFNEAVKPDQDLSQYATVTATTDFSGHPTFAQALVVGSKWCPTQVSDCPCTVDDYNQKVTIDLGAPRTITTILIYRTVVDFEFLSYRFKMHIGNTGDTNSDSLYVYETSSYNGAYYKNYTMNKVARYITFLNYQNSNMCFCKVVIFGSP